MFRDNLVMVDLNIRTTPVENSLRLSLTVARRKIGFFCTSWTSAGYATELAIGFAALSLVTIVIGVSTHSRRRRIWRAVAGLVILHTLLQIMAFGIVTEMYRTSSYPSFEQARPGTAYVLNVLSWILGVAIAFGVITTGISADKGHRWAAGNRAYHPIAG